MNASEKMDISVLDLIRFSQIPMINAPTTAPGIEPIPPKTAATNALSPGSAPEVGMTD